MSVEFKDLLKLVVVLIVLSLSVTGCGDATNTNGFVSAPQLACTVTQNIGGGALIICPDGSEGYIAAGPQGFAGHDGQDVTPVTIVQFCGGADTGGTFPERAFCLSGHLYGTLNNNATYQYLTLLHDGAYSSNGQGAACSFTITGCEVTY